MVSLAIVDGQPGAGKTTLICRLIESNRSRSQQVCRILARPESEVCAEEHGAKAQEQYPELQAWERAGALLPSVSGYDPLQGDLADVLDRIGIDPDTDDELILEGDNDGSVRPDCAVYVLRPLADGESPAVETEQVVAHIEFRDYLDAIGIDVPDDEPIVIEDLEVADDERTEAGAGEPGSTAFDESELAKLQQWIEQGVPVKGKVLGLHPNCARLDRAGDVIVINIRDASELAQAEKTRAQIRGLYTDWHKRNKLRLRGWGPPPGIYIANLADPRDPGLGKALAQLKRKLRQR
ncbi:MAG: hypothetical protein ACE15E_03125 [Acidobacteriota bacterium]